MCRLCVSVSVCTCEYRPPWRPEVGVGSPGAEVTGGSELCNMGLGTKLRSPTQAAHAHNCFLVSPTLGASFLTRAAEVLYANKCVVAMFCSIKQFIQQEKPQAPPAQAKG